MKYKFGIFLIAAVCANFIVIFYVKICFQVISLVQNNWYKNLNEAFKDLDDFHL